MDVLEGNSSDKKTFNKTIRYVREFQNQINMPLPLFQTLLGVYKEGMELGLGDSDFAVLDNLLGPR